MTSRLRRSPSGRRWEIELRRGARFADGRAVLGGDVVRWWERELRAGCADVRWLLQPIRGVGEFVDGASDHVRGLVESDRRVEILLERPVADLPARLAHPALAVFRRAADGSIAGTGPFSPARDGSLAANRFHAPGRREPLRLRIVGEPRDDPLLLLRVGQADLSLVYGDPGPLTGRLRAVRLPDWDPTYALWISTAASALRDPAHRRWLAGRVQPETVVPFPGEGTAPAVSLLSREDDRPPDGSPSHAVRPPRGTRWRLLLEAGDRHAATLAARVRAALLVEGVTIEPDPEPSAAYLRRLASGEVALALIRHQPALADPVLALRETLARLDVPAAENALDRASEIERHEGRLAAAARVERDLIRDGRLQPLARLEARLVLNEGLRQDGPGLRLERLRWRR